MTAAPLHLTRFGQGPRRALLLHCSLAHAGAWAGVAGLLAERLSMLAPDLPGHGCSPDWDGQRDYGDQCLAAVQPVLAGLDAPVDLIGHSFGAVLALQLALAQPGQLRSLVLIEPVLFAAARAGDPAAFEAHQAGLAGFAAAWTAGDLAGAASAFLGLWGAGQRWAALPADVQQDMAARIHLIAASEPLLTEDRAGLLAPGGLERLGLPVLLIAGAKTQPVIGAVHAELARRLPEVERVTIPGAGHMVPVTHAGAVAAAIAGFLDRT